VVSLWVWGFLVENFAGTLPLGLAFLHAGEKRKKGFAGLAASEP